MAEKKKETKKTTAKAKDITLKSKRLQGNVQAKAQVKEEDVYPAISIAKTFGIPDFAFYMIKEAKNLNDGSLITMSQFQKYYNEIVEGR